jgi:hypothetical protein
MQATSLITYASFLNCCEYMRVQNGMCSYLKSGIRRVLFLCLLNFYLFAQLRLSIHTISGHVFLDARFEYTLHDIMLCWIAWCACESAR